MVLNGGVCHPGQGEIAFTVFVALSERARGEVIGNLWRLGICTGGIARQNSPRSTGYAAFRASIAPVPIAERLSALCCHCADRRRGGQPPVRPPFSHLRPCLIPSPSP